MTSAPARSYLFVPANRPEMFDKACKAGADAVIVDLEDAVPFADKAMARAALAAWLSPAHPVLVRINGADSAWFDEDLALCGAPGVAGVVLSKAERADDVARVHAAGAAAILPLIESAAGFDNVRAIAAVPGVGRLVFGSIDFGLDLGIRGEREELLFFRSQLVLASRLAGLAAPVDGVTTAIGDAARLDADTLHARQMGFGGKLCIHPKQVPGVNRCFSPGEEELAWARRVLAAAAASEGAAVALDGKMIDRPVILRAQRLLDEASRV
ncbi:MULTISPECIES: CoA ester lyase [unclassified Massilia]|uniref:HpcH/HpaI aldolase/citrate lyase family protein n=1 Tax=unclassified Massilia TaxID=2609279 RepID=UPI0017834EB8|nr:MULTISPECIES: CoA ester lyase [unclassified Massilia]MBD8529284.1 CoA ester lyase [Massilia sp. CFBP 13647]MBD8672678.1 CoA ester lyase [Massilia sp. CFBP 13721]